VDHAERKNGRTSYSFKKSKRLATDIILSFSDKPLRLTVKFGFFIAFLAAAFAIYNLILFFDNKILVPGYTSLIISVWFLAGLIIMVLGVVGLYIGKTFDNVKGRPSYIIQDKTF
jgi:dolichol-phosphate mannosyltransferase